MFPVSATGGGGVTEFFFLYQQAVFDISGGFEVLFAGEPVKGGHGNIILQMKVLFKTQKPKVNKKQTTLLNTHSETRLKYYVQIFSINGHKSSHADFRSSGIGVTSLL
jgi:hypothetical protein